MGLRLLVSLVALMSLTSVSAFRAVDESYEPNSTQIEVPKFFVETQPPVVLEPFVPHARRGLLLGFFKTILGFTIDFFVDVWGDEWPKGLGPVANLFLELFWPDGNGGGSNPLDIWKLVKEEFERMIDEKILQQVMHDRQALLKTLEENVDTLNHTTHEYQGRALNNVLQTSLTLGNYLMSNSTTNIHLLGMLESVVYIQLPWLHLQAKYGREIHQGGWDPTWERTLNAKVAEYTTYFKEALPRWDEWRRGQIKTEDKRYQLISGEMCCDTVRTVDYVDNDVWYDAKIWYLPVPFRTCQQSWGTPHEEARRKLVSERDALLTNNWTKIRSEFHEMFESVQPSELAQFNYYTPATPAPTTVVSPKLRFG